MKWKHWWRPALDFFSAVLFAGLGAYWVFYAGQASGRGETWAWYLLLGLVCLVMAGVDLISAVRGLRALKRAPNAEDGPF